MFTIVKLSFSWRSAGLTSDMKSSKLSLHFRSWKLCTKMEKKNPGNNWLCLVWTTQPNEREHNVSSASIMSENLTLWSTLTTCLFDLSLAQIYKPNIFALASLQFYQSLHHQEPTFGRTKKRLSILNPAVYFGLWTCQWKDLKLFNHFSFVLFVVSNNVGKRSCLFYCQ